VDSGLVFRTGRGTAVTYRAASEEEMGLQGSANAAQARLNRVWVAVNRLGPASAEAIAEMVPMAGDQLRVALDGLLEEGKIRKEPGPPELYLSQGCFIPLGTTGGWEAALLDHYQAVVTAMCSKLQLGAGSAAVDPVGGSTYSYFVWPGHPLEQEVFGLLRHLRDEAAGLRRRVDANNEQSEKTRDEMTRVIAYVGQTVVEPGREVA
jgi:hypothetical protein